MSAKTKNLTLTYRAISKKQHFKQSNRNKKNDEPWFESRRFSPCLRQDFQQYRKQTSPALDHQNHLWPLPDSDDGGWSGEPTPAQSKSSIADVKPS